MRGFRVGVGVGSMRRQGGGRREAVVMRVRVRVGLGLNNWGSGPGQGRVWVVFDIKVRESVGFAYSASESYGQAGADTQGGQ